MNGGANRVDVVVVGGRIAGATTALLMARAGLRVVLVERSPELRDTLSSHTIQSDVLGFFDRIGILDKVRATGVQFAEQVDTRLGDLRFVAPWPRWPGDIGGSACIRRFVLDPILLEAAGESGVDVRLGARLVGLNTDDAGRVCGVRLETPDGPAEVACRLVVGADGRASTVAGLVGARRYHVVKNERSYYWSFFAEPRLGPVPTFYFHRYADRFIVGGPVDHGLFLVGVSPELGRLNEFRRDVEGSYLEHVRDCDAVSEVVGDSPRATKIFGVARFETYFREPSGPGWALVGDAGHFKDPAGGRGMGDAILQARSLTETVVAGGGDPPDKLDRSIARWGRARDREFLPEYWMAGDLGRAGPLPGITTALVSWIIDHGETDQFLGLLSHRTRPPQVITPARVLAAGLSKLRAGPARTSLMRELRELSGREVQHRWRALRPVLEAPTAREPTTGIHVPGGPPVPVGYGRTAARPASSRAMGTRNGEQDT